MRFALTAIEFSTKLEQVKCFIYYALADKARGCYLVANDSL